MATRKPNPTSRKPVQPSRHVAEGTPNPQGQQKVIPMPLRPDQRAEASHNVAQNPSTRENRMNPSVATSAENIAMDTDSMFNQADPQATELLQENNSRNRARIARRREKSLKPRKTA